MTVVTGVSGSGKSSLINDILYRALAKELYKSREEPGAHKAIHGIAQLDKVIQIDQSPIGRTPALESGDLHRRVHGHPRSVCHAAGVARARLQAGALQLQRARRTLRSLPGRRPAPYRDELPARTFTCCARCATDAVTTRKRSQVKFNGYSIADLLESAHRRRVAHPEGHVPAVGIRSCRRWSMWALATFTSVSPQRRSPAAKRSA